MRKWIIILIIGVIMSLVSIKSAAADQIIINDVNDFNGTFSDARFDETTGVIENNRSVLSGNYTSNILDVGSNANFNSFSIWKMFPYEQADQTKGEVLNATRQIDDDLQLEGYFRLGDNYADVSFVKDFSPEMKNATAWDYTGVESVPGIFNNSYEQTGNRGHIETEVDMSIDQWENYTVCGWFAPSNITATRKGYLTTNADLNGFLPNNNDMDMFRDQALKFSKDNFLIIDEWAHWCQTAQRIGYDTGWYNGELFGRITYASEPIDASEHWYIGGYNNSALGYDRYFEGKMDEVMIFQANLTREDIEILYNSSTRIRLKARTCDDALCDGEEWVYFDNYDYYDYELNLSQNRYFQYSFNFSALNKVGQYNGVHNITIDYELAAAPATPNQPPEVNLTNPSNNSVFASTNVTLDYNVSSDDDNVSTCYIYGDTNPTPTTLINTTENLGNETITYDWTGLSNNIYYWFVNCTDGDLTNTTEIRNFSINIPNIPPAVNLTNPSNNSVFGSSNVTLYYNINITEAVANCTIYGDNTPNPTTLLNTQTNIGNTSISYSWNGLTTDMYYWFVNCTDGIDVNTTEIRNFTTIVLESFNFEVYDYGQEFISVNWSAIDIETAEGSTCIDGIGAGVADCSDCDDRFVNIAGDEMTGQLNISSANLQLDSTYQLCWDGSCDYSLRKTAANDIRYKIGGADILTVTSTEAQAPSIRASSGEYYGLANGYLRLNAERNMLFNFDTDNVGGRIFEIYKNGAAIFTLSGDSGDVTITGDLTVQDNVEINGCLKYNCSGAGGCVTLGTCI